MKAENETTICCLSRSTNEGYIRTAVAAFLCQLDPMVNELADIKTAVSEAATNAIVHGYPRPAGKDLGEGADLSRTAGLHPH